jgi:hypothetical protein
MIRRWYQDAPPKHQFRQQLLYRYESHTVRSNFHRALLCNIRGEGFNWTQNDLVVQFGDKELKGSDIVVMDEFQIKIIGIPGNSAGDSVRVVVQNPIATSNPKIFTYYARVPIEFTNGELITEYGPTTITFGPDGIIYVGTVGDDLLKISLDDGLNAISFLRSSIVGSVARRWALHLTHWTSA